jgi:hypothetical protein
VDLGVTLTVVPEVRESKAETVNVGFRHDRLLNGSNDLPNSQLFLNVEVEKLANMPTRGDNSETADKRFRMKHHNRDFRKQGSIAGRDGAIEAR